MTKKFKVYPPKGVYGSLSSKGDEKNLRCKYILYDLKEAIKELELDNVTKVTIAEFFKQVDTLLDEQDKED